MVNVIYINSDGTVDAYDKDDCKVPSLSGDYTILHTIVEYALEKCPSNLPDECRIINVEYYFRISNTHNVLPLTLKHIRSMCNYIKKENNNNKKKGVESRIKGNSKIEILD